MDGDWSDVFELTSFSITQTGVMIDQKYNRTGLHWAAIYKNISEAEQLLSQGADVNAKDKLNRTPLHFAAKINTDESHYEMAEVLLKNGADINARDDKNLTPLYYLVGYANVRTVQLFVDYKADLNVKNNDGWSLLTTAAKHCNKNVEVLQLLIDLGLDVNHRSTDQSTPVDEAIKRESDNIQIIKCLLKNDAVINNKSALIEVVRVFRSSRLYWDIKIKTLNLIMNCTDFNVIPDDAHILSLNYKAEEDYLWKIFLKHLAVLDSLNISIHSVFLNTISEKKEYANFYERCKKELAKAKSIKLANCWITFHNLLVDARKKLKNYAGNSDIIKVFEKSDCRNKFPVYGTAINENVKKAIKRRVFFDKSADLLSDCLPIFNPTHLIIKDILDCILSKKYLSKFCNQN